jgi:hypothetical protein
LNEVKNLTIQQRRFSISEISKRWGCTEQAIFDLIQDGIIPIYSKSFLFSINSNEASALLSVPIVHSDNAKKIIPFLNESNEIYTSKEDWNPLDDYPVRLSNGEDHKLDDEGIAIASTEHFSQCFFLINDILEYEKKHRFYLTNLNDASKTNKTDLPLIKRASKFNECIAQAMFEFKKDNGYSPTSVDEVLNRIKHKPPRGFQSEFNNDHIIIEDVKTDIRNFERSIKRLL